MTSLWQDKERRRAALLSVLIHVAALLALVLFVSLPRPTPIEPFVVIDIGTPSPSDVQTDAATVDAPAPESDTVDVEAERLGRPAAAPAPEPVETPPVAEPAEEVPEEPAQAEAEPEPAEEPAETAEVPAERPVEAEAPPVESPPEEVEETAPPRPAAPAAVAPPPTPVPESLPGAPATSLPEIEQETLAPRPLAESIPVPRPTVAAEVPAARDIAPQPRAEVAAAQEVPRPSVTASVPDATAVPTPQVTASVPEARPVPTPSVQSSVASPRSVPTPSVRAQVATPNAIPRPAASANVAAARPVPQPAARADVAAAAPVPAPAVSAAVPSPRSVPTPDVRAAVTAPPTRDAGAGAADVPEGADTPRGNRPLTGPEGGNANQAGQPDPPAEGRGEGLATGEGQGTGVPARPEPYSAFRRSPVAVLLDNANGYPQSGLVEAAVVVEMPVEGGITRLMPLYDNNDPPSVGPVRSARDYFVRVAESYDSVLVHDGGSPSALQAIAQSPTPTLNAFSRGELFVRAVERNAPYNLYSAGDALRAAVNRIRTSGVRAVTGTLYRPPQEAREVVEIDVPYGGTYGSGFAFQPALGSYRWIRNGTPAVDAQGEQVRADAVLVARIDARPFPDDPAGRLYVPLDDGGPATLYILGRAVDGAWYLEDGVRFRTEDGSLIDLRPYKTWMAFTPTYDTRVER